MKKIVISIHDVTPHFQKEIKEIFNALNKLNIKKYDILVIPDFEKENKEFNKFIKKHLTKDSRIVLHGYAHKTKNRLYNFIGKIIGQTTGFEFYSIKEKEILEKIEKGLKIIKKRFNVQPVGFVPPVWKFTKSKRNLLFNYFDYYTDYYGIYYKNKKIKAIALCFIAGNFLFDKIIQMYSIHKIKTTKDGVLRFTIHPQDIKVDFFEKEMNHLKLLLKNGWELSLYEELK